MTAYLGFSDVMAMGSWLLESEVKGLERDFCRYLGLDHALATSYGRTALYLALKAIGVEGGEVLLPAFTCTVVRHAVISAGGLPRFVDVHPITFEMDPSELEKKISSQTKAIIVIHYFGDVAENIEELVKIARRRGTTLVEDCAHSLGAWYQGRKAGTFGDMAIFSLTKSTVNFGGGVLASADRSLISRAAEYLRQEAAGWKRQWVDFPLVFSYGVEQAIEKVVYGRVRRPFLFDTISRLPDAIIGLRNCAILLAKGNLRAASTALGFSAPVKGSTGEANGSNSYSLNMERIIASLGRSQFEKLDQFIRRRREIVSVIARELPEMVLNRLDVGGTRRVYTNLVLHCLGTTVEEAVARCRRQGLFLKGTWPTHQKLWQEQQTRSIESIKTGTLIWNVNPVLTEHEIGKLVNILKNSLVGKQ